MCAEASDVQMEVQRFVGDFACRRHSPFCVRTVLYEIRAVQQQGGKTNPALTTIPSYIQECHAEG